MKVDLQGRIALVTGAAKGIGACTAGLLAANGATVIVADIDEAAARQTAAALPGARALRMDIANDGEIEAGVRRLRADFGRIDILVNNAGFGPALHLRRPIHEFPIEEWDRVIDGNLRGLFVLSRAVAPLMLAQKSGRIVNISSVIGVVPARLQCPYGAAKAAVINLTRALALELGPSGILVNSVAPGSTITTATEKLFYSDDPAVKKNMERLLAHIPLGRAGRPEEIAHAVLFLVAPENSYLTGQTLTVDGGWSAGGFFQDF